MAGKKAPTMDRVATVVEDATLGWKWRVEEAGEMVYQSTNFFPSAGQAIANAVHGLGTEWPGNPTVQAATH